MPVNIPLPLACKTIFFDGRGFAEHQSSLLWSVSENAHYSRTIWDIWIKFFILNYFNFVQNGDKGMTSIILDGQGFLVKMLITLEPHGIF